MSDKGKKTLTSIRNNSQVNNILTRLLYTKETLSYEDAFYLYSLAHLLLEEYEKDTEKTLLVEYAYYISTKTSFKLNDYTALFDLAINLGFYPLARKIISLNLPIKISITSVFLNFEIENFRSGNKVLTYEQWKEFKNVLASENENVSFIAPTSYGKSDLIKRYILENDQIERVAIIVPTKSLIFQVYNEFKDIEGFNRKIIVHDQNYSGGHNRRVLAIVTQERGIRLLEKGLVFDMVFIDEAHEIMKFDFGKDVSNRSLILIRFIRMSMLLNSELKLMYCSPLINDIDNLRFKGQSSIEIHKIKKDLKLYEVKYLDKSKNCFIYDKYLGEYIKLAEYSNSFDYIFNIMKFKNLHFLYRPVFIENYSEELYNYLPDDNDISDEISSLIEELKELVHPKFKLIKYLSKGIVYLHSKVPQIIRNYIIHHINISKDIKHIIANSVILAGMNLPIDNLIYISGYSNINDLINLMGRVNRLSEIFKDSNNSIEKIFIPINFVEMERYPQASNGNMRNKIESLRLKRSDIVKNPLLENATIDKSNKKKSNEIILSENQIIDKYYNDNFYTKLLKSGAQNILNYTEKGLKKLKEKLRNIKVIESEEIMLYIKRIFFDGFIYNEDFSPQNNVLRLQNIETIQYYEKFLENMKQYPLSSRINRLVGYWQNNSKLKQLVYIGKSFGEEVYQTNSYRGIYKVYIDINKYKNDVDKLYNFAIIKLQIDEEFISHEITILLNVLLDFGLINEEQFNYFIYGSESKEELLALEIGISRNTFLRLKKDNQINNISLDIYENPYANSELKKYIQKQKGIYRFELESYFRI